MMQYKKKLSTVALCCDIQPTENQNAQNIHVHLNGDCLIHWQIPVIQIISHPLCIIVGCH